MHKQNLGYHGKLCSKYVIKEILIYEFSIYTIYHPGFIVLKFMETLMHQEG